MESEKPKLRNHLTEAGVWVLALAVFSILFYGLTRSDDGVTETRSGAPVTDSPGDGDFRLANHEIEELHLLTERSNKNVDLFVHRLNGEIVRVRECTISIRSDMECETIPLDMVESVYGDLTPPG